jgi:hypothetical protein
VALLGIPLFGGLSAWRLLMDASRHLDVFLVAALEQALHREVRVGPVDVLRPGQIHVRGLAIAAGPTFASGDLLHARDASVQYRLWDILRGRIDAVGSIESVDIDEPYLLIVRSASNHFNLQDLFPKTHRPAKPTTFRGIVRLHNGSVRFVDYAARDLPVPQVNSLGGINATLDGGGPPLMALQFAARGDGRRVAGVSGSGSIQADLGAFAFRVKAQSGAAPYWSRYFARISALNLRSGAGEVTVDVFKPRQKSFTSASIRVDAVHASATTPWLLTPIENASGSIVIRTGHPLETGLDITGTTAGIPVHAYGDVFTGPNGRVALRVDASGVTLPALRRVSKATPQFSWLAAEAPASAQALIYGPVQRITTLVAVQVPRAKLYTVPLRDVRASVRYEDHVITIPSVTGTAGGRALRGSGQIDTRTKALNFVADVPSVAARALGLPRLPLTGDVSSHLAITGTTSAPRVGALVVARNGRFKGIPYNRLAARVSVAGKTARISDAVAVLPGATVFADGEIGLDGTLNLHVNAADARLERLGPAVGFGGVSGAAFFVGDVTGSIAAPQVTGDARVFGANVRGQQIDVANGGVDWRPGRVRFRRVRIARYPTMGWVDGVATQRPDGQISLNLRARLQTGRIEALLAERHLDPVATGNVETAQPILIHGTLASPIITGRAAITDASFEGYPVGNATGAFRVARGVVEVSDLEAVSQLPGEEQPTRVAVPLLRLANGRLTSAKPFSITNLRLERFDRLGGQYARIGGTINVVAGIVSGSPRHPLVSAGVSVPGLTINSVGFENAGFNIAYDGDSVTLTDLRLDRAGRRVVDSPRLKWNLHSHQASAELRVAALRINDVKELLTRSDWFATDEAAGVRRALITLGPQSPDAALSIGDVAGSPSGPLRIGGNLGNLTAEGAVTLAGVQIDEQKLDRVSVSGAAHSLRIRGGRIEAGFIDVPDGGLHAEAASMLLDGGFSGHIGGSLKAYLDAKNVPLMFARPFLPANLRSRADLGGDLTLRADASGPMSSPEVLASVTSRDITVGARKFPFSIRTGTIAVRNGPKGPVISANSIRLLAKDHAISVEGTLPFDWSSLSIRPNEPISVSADINEQGLDILKTLSEGSGSGLVESATGSVVGQVSLAGTREKLSWNGYLRVSNGAVKLRALTHALRDIQADLRFDPVHTGLVVNSFTMASAAGGSLSIVPNSSLRLVSTAKTWTLVPDLAINLDTLRLEETPNYMKYGERVRGNVATPDGPVRIVQGPRGPSIKGSVTLSNVDLLPPNTSPTPPSGQTVPSLVPSFDLTLVSGKNVWVRNALFRIHMDERGAVRDRSLSVTGDLLQPRIEGRLTSHDGIFTFPTARFKLTDMVVQIHYPPVQDVMGASLTSEGASPLNITANAQARLMAMVSGRRQPVTVFMHVEGGGVAASMGPGYETLAPYRFTLRSSPSLPERQLTALITREEALQALAQGGATQDVLRQEAMNVLQARVLPEALSGIENRLGAAFGLESLSLDYLNQDRAVSVSAAKRIGNRLVLSYTRPVGGATTNEAYTVSLSYQISQRLRLTLQQQKGPILYGTQTTALPATQANVVDTQILLEGTKSF